MHFSNPNYYISFMPKFKNVITFLCHPIATYCIVSQPDGRTFSHFVFPLAPSHDSACKLHVLPCGQQCTPSAQQTAFSRSQHPHPVRKLQQVVLSGHCVFLSGHVISPEAIHIWQNNAKTRKVHIPIT